MTPGQWPLAYDPNNVKPGWIAFGVVMALLVATFLLWRSMNTQLGRIKVPHRADFNPPRQAGSGDGEAGTSWPDGSGSTGSADEGPGDAGPS